jgi:hypothetical protein
MVKDYQGTDASVKRPERSARQHCRIGPLLNLDADNDRT